MTGELECGRIARSLRERIERGEFRDGQKLSMRKLAAEYGASRPAVRDALRALGDDGLAAQETASAQWRVDKPDPSSGRHRQAARRAVTGGEADHPAPRPARLRPVADRASGRGLAAMTPAEARAELEHRPAAMPGGLLAAFTLPAAPESAGAARRRVRAALSHTGLRELAGDAEAIVSEFVANAVRHARSPAAVALITAGGALMIITADSSPEPPAISTAQDGAESGRGLLIVDAITGGQWGWSTSSTGKWVWASLRLV